MKEAGRPTKYDERFHPELAHYMARVGMTDKQIAKNLHIAESTLNLWKERHPKFSESLKSGKDIPDDKVEAKLLENAIGYQHPEDKIFNHNGVPLIVPTIKHYPPNPTSQIFWLKNRRPDRWRDKQDVETSGEIKITFDDQDKDL